MIIIEKILDIQTGLETVIEREETPDEKKNRLKEQAFFAQETAAAEAKAQAKAAAEGKLAALGLTTDDLRALGL